MIEKRRIRRDCVLILQRSLFFIRFRLQWHRRMARAAAQFVEDEVSRDLKQPSREFRSRLIALSILPDTNENLLRDVFRLGVAAEHATHRADHESLMPFDKLLER